MRTVKPNAQLGRSTTLCTASASESASATATAKPTACLSRDKSASQHCFLPRAERGSSDVKVITLRARSPTFESALKLEKKGKF